MSKIKLALVGAGNRGRTLGKTAIKTKEYEIIAISDPHLPNAEKTIKEERFVDIPDFTRGKYKERKPKDVIDFD